MIDNLRHWKLQFRSTLEQMMSSDEYQSLNEEIKNTYAEYSRGFSKCIRLVNENFGLANLAPHHNLFFIEYKLCLLMKAFRENLDSKVIKKMLELDKKITDEVQRHNAGLRSELDQFNQIGFNLYESWDPKLIEVDSYFEEIKVFEFSEMIFPSYKAFMKKKIHLNEEIITQNQDLSDFFEYYTFLYNSDSKYVITHIQCNVCFRMGPNEKVTESQLVLDVSLGLIPADLSNLQSYQTCRLQESPEACQDP